MARVPEKITDRLKEKVWLRDNSSCQKCGKNLSKIKIIDPCKEILEELHALKEIRIYKWERNCWKCQKRTPRVSYCFHAPFGYSIGGIEKLDTILMEKYPFVKKVYSNTMEQEIIANICIHCGSLQGNWYIMEDLISDIVYQGLDNFLDITLPNDLTLEDLNINKEDPMFQKYEKVDTFGHVHHIDGDRSNNLLENLLLLCPSCHKKADIERKRNRNN